MSAALAFLPPSIDTSADWLTKDQLIELAQVSGRWIEMLTAKQFIITRERSERGRNGRPVREYLVSSLPAELRAKLEPAPQPAAAPAPSPLAIAPLFAGVPDAPAVRAVVPPKHQATVAAKLKLIQPLLEFKADPAKFRGLQVNGKPVTSLDLLADYIATTETAAGRPISRPTLWRMVAAYRKQGDVGLAPKIHPQKGRSRWASENRDMADLAAYVSMGDTAQPGQSVMVAWERVCAYANERGLEAPSYETVRSFLLNPNEVSRSMKTLQAQGKRGYEAMFAGYLQRGYTEPANDVWMSDHMICDTLVIDDCFDRDMKHCRVQMTTILDFRSRFVVGVSWCRNGSSNSIKRAMLQAILNHGLPNRFYCDNGKDYRKVAKGATGSDVQAAIELALEEMGSLEGGIMKRLAIPVTYCKPFHPQSKHIERYHKTFHDRFDRAFHTYTSGKTHLRRDETGDALTRHKKLLVMGDTRTSDLPLASEYIAMAEAWIARWYHQHAHEGEGMDGRTPADCFLAERDPNTRPAPPLDQLAALMAETKRAKIRNMAVEINGVRFVPGYNDLRASVVMHERSGSDDKVVVAFDPLDMSRAAVLDADGFPLCQLEAQVKTRFSQDAETSAAIQNMSQQRGMLAKAVRTSVKDLGERVRAAGHQPLVEQLRQQAGLPATTTHVDSIVQRPQPRKTASGETAAPTYISDAVEEFWSAGQ